MLCNIAAKGPAHCHALHQKAGLLSLLGALALSDDQAVNQVLELAHLLFLHWPEVQDCVLLHSGSGCITGLNRKSNLNLLLLIQAAIDFVAQSGLQALERHRDNLLLQEKVKALIRTASQLAASLQNCPLEASAEDL